MAPHYRCLDVRGYGLCVERCRELMFTEKMRTRLKISCQREDGLQFKTSRVGARRNTAWNFASFGINEWQPLNTFTQDPVFQ